MADQTASRPPSVTPVGAEAAEWHYLQNGQQSGPVLGSQLRQLAASGHLRPSDMVWKNGMPGWASADSIQNLFQPRPPQSPPPAPPRAPPRARAAEPAERPRAAEPAGRKIDLALLAVLDTLIEDPIIFKWAKQQLDGDEQKVRQFQRHYLDKKKSKGTAHMLNLVALFGIGGLHRFYLGDPALGIAHLLTWGFCLVGTLIDIFAINKRVNDANVKVAMQTIEVIHAL